MNADHQLADLEAQILTTIGLVKNGRYVAAASAVARLSAVPDAHVSCVIAELELGHAQNAIVALELIQSVYCPGPRPRLRLVADDRGSLT